MRRAVFSISTNLRPDSKTKTQKMKKILALASMAIILNSCVVTTAAKVVTTTAKVGYSVVKGTVKGVSWAVQKAEGKINEDRLDGTWKIVGVYNGSYDDFAKDKDPDNSFSSQCSKGVEQIEFNAKKKKFKPVHCSSEKESWNKYKYKFGKHPRTKTKENYIQYNNSNYITIIDVSNKTMVLEGNLMPSQMFSGTKLYLLEKK